MGKQDPYSTLSVYPMLCASHSHVLHMMLKETET